ncbi:ubiquitin-like modifier-activating enzyme ATG7 [Caerostris extrusa]|uniref:Ubiquitin-like modifier-activating enzyme ATG7 n=1 Tax=Caerostris extrusa TaxID=172846 RepID=A0AAV4XXG8_CAEEX|nr:ubiquitin-like modifier-activating enzyme ATG7 [Caerostris extrusa]
MSDEVLQFVPFSSAIDTGFWYQLTKKKLDIFKLDDAAVKINGFYSTNSSLALPPICNIDYSAFDDDIQIPPGSVPLKGLLMNTNTVEDFKIRDKKALLQSVGQKIWEAITSGAALENPLLLQAFPALNYPDSIICKGSKKFCEYFTSDQISQFLESYDALLPSDKSLFLVFKDNEGCSVFDLKNIKL